MGDKSTTCLLSFFVTMIDLARMPVVIIAASPLLV
jgi:hypothetical protein